MSGVPGEGMVAQTCCPVRRFHWVVPEATNQLSGKGNISLSSEPKKGVVGTSHLQPVGQKCR